MELRKADTKDLEALIANRMEFVRMMNDMGNPIPENFDENNYKYMKEHISDDSMVVWIAIDQGKIVASAMVCYYQLLPTLSNQTGKTGYIMNVFTHTDYRKQGLASALVNKVIEDAKEKNVGRLLLHASDMGKPVYEKLGFEMALKEMIYSNS